MEPLKNFSTKLLNTVQDTIQKLCFTQKEAKTEGGGEWREEE